MPPGAETAGGIKGSGCEAESARNLQPTDATRQGFDECEAALSRSLDALLEVIQEYKSFKASRTIKR